MQTLVTKGGRSRTGSDLRGQIIHIVNEHPQNGFWATPALCGAKPARKGYGWLEMPSDFSGKANCEKCLSRLLTSFI